MFWLLKSTKNKLFDALYKNNCTDSLNILQNKKSLINAIDENNYTTLALASKAGCLDVVKFLFDYGIKSVNFKAKDGVSALELAVKGNYFKIVDILLKNGADSSIRDANNETILHWVNYKPNLDIAKSILAHGADIDAIDNKRKTPLHLAIECKNKEFAKFLLQNGAKTTLKDNNLKTPIDYADDDMKDLFQNKG
jgi:ankyrin repeat protein